MSAFRDPDSLDMMQNMVRSPWICGLRGGELYTFIATYAGFVHRTLADGIEQEVKLT